MTKPILLILILTALPILYRITNVLVSRPQAEFVGVKHLAIIMDGNRRWAKKRNQLAQYGHKHGFDKFKLLIEYCLKKNIEMLSVYAWSLENFKRSPQEVEETFKIMTQEAEKALPHLVKHGVKIHFVGDQNCFPQSVRSTIEHLEKRDEELLKAPG